MTICVQSPKIRSRIRVPGATGWPYVIMALFGLAILAAPPLSAQSAAPSHQAAMTAAGHGAVAEDESTAALRSFAREIGLAPAPASAANDRAYSALLDFARMVGADAANTGAPKTVAADDKASIRLAQAPADPKPSAKPAPAKPAAAKPVAVKPAAKPAGKKENKGGEGDAYFVGSAKCATCHAEVTAEFATTLMGRIGRTARKGTMECENCHGPGSKHVAAGGGQNEGMIAYRPGDPRYNIQEINETCLTCHEKGQQTAWKGSTHETRGLACTNCHTVMRNVTTKNLLSAGAEVDVCFQCHKQAQAQMQRSSHMPVREGKMTCANCHNPHGSVYGTEAMLREPSINDNCYKCHAEKRGPMLHEHPPVRENCLNCHDAHGSNHEYLLKVQRPRLCAECHGFAHGGQPGFTSLSNYAFGHGCNNCHSQVHGSNHPGGQWFQR